MTTDKERRDQVLREAGLSDDSPPAAKATAPTISREILEDRYRGLTDKMNANGGDIEYTKLQSQLSAALHALAMGTARCHADDTAGIIDDLFVMIRTKIIDGILADGIADPEPWSQYKAEAA